jgi:O-antigen biosynthesis protein WbqP
VRPGITGLAQVNGVDMSDADRLAEIDARYVRTQSLSGDFKLIWATLRGQGIGVDQVVSQG